MILAGIQYPIQGHTITLARAIRSGDVISADLVAEANGQKVVALQSMEQWQRDFFGGSSL